MTKETLRSYLHNYPPVQAIEQKRQIDNTRQDLLHALQVLRTAGVSELVQAEVQGKYDEYGKISRNYGVLLEDTWNVMWQDESIIRNYTDCCDDDIDHLPDTINMP